MSEPEEQFIPESQEIDEKTAAVVSTDENLLNNPVHDDLPINESQDFSLDFAETQEIPGKLEQTNKQSLEIINSINEKPVEARDNTAVVEVNEKLIIEPENIQSEVNKPSKIIVEDEEDEVVEATPPEDLFSPTKRLLLGTTMSLKRKADNINDDLAPKVPRSSSDEDFIPESQEIPDSPEISTINVDKPETDSIKLGDANDNTMAANEPSQMVENVVAVPITMEVDTVNATEPEASSGSVEVNLEKTPSSPVKIPELQQTDNSTDKPKQDSSEPEIPAKKSRHSIEVIYDKALAPRLNTGPKELVEIDEEGEKIVLDSSQEDLSFKSATEINKETPENKLTNGNDEQKSDGDKTASLKSSDSSSNETKTPIILNLVSDSEGESSITEDKIKSKCIPIEKEVCVLIKIKCFLQVDETTKEITNKEIGSVCCEAPPLDLHGSRRRNHSDASALADISDDTKDPISPASVTSNPPPYNLLPSRLSIMSMVSSSSSSSSGSIKQPSKDGTQFSLPRIPKHIKKAHENSGIDDVADRLKKEWKNVNLIDSTVLKYINDELNSADFHNGTHDTGDSTMAAFTSSTPELGNKNLSTTTPKSIKRGRVAKRTRNQNARAAKANGIKSPPTITVTAEVINERKESESDDNTSIGGSVSSPSRQTSRSLANLRATTPIVNNNDPLVGKCCFARWTDRNYYPGIVAGRTKSKLKIDFLDGKSKLMLEDWVVTTPTVLPIGMSVYATTEGETHGSCGVITGHEDKEDEKLMYTVDTDDGEKFKVPIDEIFLSVDQVQILREAENNILRSPTTPQTSKISLDNLVDGTRRIKSPVVSTPKSGRSSRSSATKRTVDVKPSSSGLRSKLTFATSESDSNVSGQEGSGSGLGGVHPEVIGGNVDFVPKGPQSRMKGKARSKKKQDDPETIKTVGPIPPEGSELFKGMNFVLTCAPLESLDKYKAEFKTDSNSEVGTEYEEEWTRTPFIRERLIAQIEGGSGKVYDNFDELPKEEWKNTRLITNVPNATERSLLCLSAGIPSFNHQWIIRCCQEVRSL